MKLDGKVAIVTGGAMGNGLGVVKTFLKYGARVIVIDYSDKLTESLKSLDNPMLMGYQADLRDKETLEAIIDDVIEKYGKIDILVNNAGIAKLERFIDMSDEVRDTHFDINIKGTWNITKCVLPHMVKANYGKVVNLSSVTGPMVADSGEVAYATTKAALLGFTKSLAMEVVENNITVNAIMPGYILTPMVEGIAVETDKDNPQSVIDGGSTLPETKSVGV